MLDTYESITKDDKDWLAILSGQSVPDATFDTIREARALRMVLLATEEETETEFAKTADPQWQLLKNQLIAEGYIKPEPNKPKLSAGELVKVFISNIVNTSHQLTEFLTWQKLSVAAVYTVLVSVVTLTWFPPPDPAQTQPKPAQMQPKSGGPGEGQKQTHRVILRPVTDPQQSVLELQAEFITKGIDKKDVTVFKNESDPQQWIVAIQLAKNPPPRDLREVYKKYQIDSEQNRWVYFIVKPE